MRSWERNVALRLRLSTSPPAALANQVLEQVTWFYLPLASLQVCSLLKAFCAFLQMFLLSPRCAGKYCWYYQSQNQARKSETHPPWWATAATAMWWRCLPCSPAQLLIVFSIVSWHMQTNCFDMCLWVTQNKLLGKRTRRSLWEEHLLRSLEAFPWTYI